MAPILASSKRGYSKRVYSRRELRKRRGDLFRPHLCTPRLRVKQDAEEQRSHRVFNHQLRCRCGVHREAWARAAAKKWLAPLKQHIRYIASIALRAHRLRDHSKGRTDFNRMRSLCGRRALHGACHPLPISRGGCLLCLQRFRCLRSECCSAVLSSINSSRRPINSCDVLL